MSDHQAARDVREVTRCPSTRDGIKCHMTVGHQGKHAGVAKGGTLVYWENEPETEGEQ